MKNNQAGELIRAIRALTGCHAVKITGSSTQECGLWDVLCCVEGRMIWIELKDTGDTLSRVQKSQRALWSAAGAAHVLAGPGMTIKDVLDRLDCARPIQQE